jgi:hypothetical protein
LQPVAAITDLEEARLGRCSAFVFPGTREKRVVFLQIRRIGEFVYAEISMASTGNFIVCV